MKDLVRIRSVTVLDGYRVRLELTDDNVKEVDLEPYLRGPVFEVIRNDRETFCAVSVDQRMGTLVWPNGADIDPDVPTQGLQPAWMQEDKQQRRTG